MRSKLLHVFLPHGGKENRKGGKERPTITNGLIDISIRSLITIFRTIKGKAEFMTGKRIDLINLRFIIRIYIAHIAL